MFDRVHPLCLCLILSLLWPWAAVMAEPDEEGSGALSALVTDLSSPRATMRTLLVAIQDVEQNHSNRIHAAISTLDLDYLTESDQAALQQRAALLVKRLAKLIDRLGVHLEDIPDQGVKKLWYFYRQEPPSGGKPLQIALERKEGEGTWHFNGATISSIPALEDFLVQEEKGAAADEDVALARRNARATMNTFLKAFSSQPADLKGAVMTLDSSQQEPAVWKNIATRRAVELKGIMDRTRFVVLTEIPNDPSAEDFTWYTGEEGSIVIGRVAEGEYRGEWRFTPETVAGIESFYQAMEGRPLLEELRLRGVTEELTLGMRLERMMPQWLRATHFGLQGWQWLALGLLLLLGLIVRGGFPWLVRVAAAPLLRRKLVIDDAIQRSAFDAFGLLAMLLLWLTVLNQLQLPAELLAFVVPIIKFLVTLSLVYAGYRLVDVIGGQVISNRDVRLTSNDELLIPLIRKILRILVVVVVVMFIMEFWFNQPPSTIIGALGIGGIAIALAAQSTLGNFFGSLTVLVDRPFGIGDWVVIGDVEGTVEHVGFRSTRIRTFYNSLISVPNSKMVDDFVDNYGVRQFRRIKILLSVTYDTPPEKIEAFCEGIRELIRLHPYTRKDYYHVYLNQFAASSLDILLYAFLSTPDWSTELRERHALFLDILRLAQRLEISFAFPTQTLHLAAEGEREKPSDAAPGTTESEQLGVSAAAAIFGAQYGTTGEVLRPPVVIAETPRSGRLSKERR
ncbi:MAG: mechanosensitive ion channel family protein [Gammaproteobacteria bacterium]|nr:mechanosensitive ion channel family protein [Gammaproteobacteria bacterium]